MDCLFCKIIAGEIPSTKIYEDEYVYAFADIEPQAPFHAIIVPKTHIASANEITAQNCAVVAHIFAKIGEIAALVGIKDDGYRIINNCGEDGAQTVKHIHFHLIGGVKLTEKLNG